MTVDEIKAALKVTSDAQVAKKFEEMGWGCTPPLMTQWRKRGVPLGRQCWLQIKTRGRLKADPKLLESPKKK